MKFKIGKYFTTYSITAGLLIAMAGSAFLYMAWLGLQNRLLETIFALLFFWFLLSSEKKVWFWAGAFLSLLWFWWILVSFSHYHLLWAIPIGALVISGIYGGIFWAIAWLGDFIVEYCAPRTPPTPKKKSPLSLTRCARCCGVTAPYIKVLGLLGLSYIHPLGFDWFKPEFVLVHTYLGVGKWQFALLLLAILLAQTRRNILYLLPVVLAYSPVKTVTHYGDTRTIALAGTMTSVEDKWNPKYISAHIQEALAHIDKAISTERKIIILPESVFPFFLNNEPQILDALRQKSKQISIVIGALYLDGKIHRNATYLFKQGQYTIANKVILVPFGESNPLPEWAGNWVNRIFFDGAIDYIASAKPTDFEIEGTRYRNAICYEATSEALYQDAPKQMIVTSNNAWFDPSIEPTEQKLLLEFYVKKYGTAIYHSINGSPSYSLRRRHDQ